MAGRVATGAAAAGAMSWMACHRTSAAVQQWRPSALPGEQAGPLHVRSGGASDPVVVLLHGLVATGDVFGAAFDQLTTTNTLVVPDLLGFARSLDESRSHFSPDDHLDALDQSLSLLGLDNRPLTVGAHSMGAAVAVRWAERHPDMIRKVVCWGAPIYANRGALDNALADSGLMARAFVADTSWSRWACRVNCHYRKAAGWVAVAASPALPVAIARAASLHTWPAYRDAMTQLVGDTDWSRAAGRLADKDIKLNLVWGTRDRIGDRDLARTLAGAQVTLVPEADHRIPMTHGAFCASQLDPRAVARDGQSDA